MEYRAKQPALCDWKGLTYTCFCKSVAVSSLLVLKWLGKAVPEGKEKDTQNQNKHKTKKPKTQTKKPLPQKSQTKPKTPTTNLLYLTK